jgi:hypothetical protein
MQGIMKAYASAVKFLLTMAEADAAYGVLLYVPNYFFRMLLTATTILLKVLSSSYAVDVDDFDSAKKFFNNSLVLLSRCSIQNNDAPGKVAKLMAQSTRAANQV